MIVSGVFFYTAYLFNFSLPLSWKASLLNDAKYNINSDYRYCIHLKSVVIEI